MPADLPSTSTCRVPDVPMAPGCVIDGATLRPRITDTAVFASSIAEDPLSPALIMLFSGQPEQAQLLLRQAPPSFRVRALLADCERDLGRPMVAVERYRALLDEVVGTAREHTIRQHYGKALLAAGRVDDAVTEFMHVVALREKLGDDVLTASAHQALDRARQLAHT